MNMLFLSPKSYSFFQNINIGQLFITAKCKFNVTADLKYFSCG